MKRWLMVVPLATREVSLGKMRLGIIVESLVVSPDSKHLAYVAERGKKQFVVVDGEEGKEYDSFLRGSKFVFDSAKSFHTLARCGNEIFRGEVEIETAS